MLEEMLWRNLPAADAADDVDGSAALSLLLRSCQQCQCPPVL